MINRTLPIITTLIDPWIPDMVATCEGNTHKNTTPTTSTVITDVACSSVRVLWTPCEHIRRTDRDGTTPRDGNFYRPIKRPVLIGGNTVSPTRTGIQEIVSIHGSIGSGEIGDTQKFDTSIDGNLAQNGDSTTIFSKVIRRELSHDPSVTSTCAFGWTSRVMPSELKHHISCIWGSRTSTHQMNSGTLVPLL